MNVEYNTHDHRAEQTLLCLMYEVLVAEDQSHLRVLISNPY